MNYLLNTNIRHSRQDHDQMLAYGRAAAFYERKSVIDRLSAGDQVFLYQSRVGIVAFGKADGKLVVRDHAGNQKEEHHMQLNSFRYVSPPLTATEIKEVTKEKRSFNHTISIMKSNAAKKVASFVRSHDRVKQTQHR
jgi:hypothetical protein